MTEPSVLHAYRNNRRLDIPSAFTSSYNQKMLTRPGISQLSPTMARHKDKRRVSKDNLALAIRKDFNAYTVSENEAVTSFLYAVQNQGTCYAAPLECALNMRVDKKFRMRFEST